MSAQVQADGRDPRFEVAPEYLERYGDLLINFALGHGEGIKTGDCVLVIAPESAKPLYVELCRSVWRAGGNVLADFRPDDGPEQSLEREFYELAGQEQIEFFPAKYLKGMIDQIDHLVYISCEADPQALKTVPPDKLIAHQQSRMPLVKWQTEKENAGRLTWTIALYGTEGMAAEARLPIEDYWQEIIRACFLDQPDPKARWREVMGQMQADIDALNALPIERLHVKGPDADLTITLGEKRQWIGGRGANIPSFEIFTSPDWRGTRGWIRFSEPLYAYGSLITGIELTFKDGLVTKATAAENEPLLLEMLGAENANRVGEFSMTDGRLSPITRFMASTLYDENVGGEFGNTHVAVGHSINECYDGDPQQLTDEDWKRLGFNESVVHTDIVSTTDREVTAVLHDGTSRTIYASGQFQLD